MNPVACISIIGLKNSGKSFMMNHIIGIENAFKVKSPEFNYYEKDKTVISFFSEPLKIEKDNIAFDIYIMDSEGLYLD